MTIQQACGNVIVECEVPREGYFKCETTVFYDCPTDDFTETSFDIAADPRTRDFGRKLGELWGDFCKSNNIRKNSVTAVVVTGIFYPWKR